MIKHLERTIMMKKKKMNYKRLIIITVVSIMTLLGVSGLQLSSYASTGDVILVGYSSEYGTVIEQYDGSQTGLAPDYFDMISDYTGDTYEFVKCDYEDAASMLANGEIDLFGPITYEQEYADSFLYTDEPFGEEGVYLMSLKVEAMEYDDYNNIENQIIGVLSGSPYVKLLEDFCEQNEINPQIIQIPERVLDESSPNTLIVTSSFQYQSQYEAVAMLGYENLYYIAREDDQELMESINSAMNNVRMSHASIFDDLYSQYYQEVSYAKLYISEQEIAALQAKDVYRVSYYVDHIPFSYNDINNDPAGIAITVMNEIATEAGINIEYVPLYKDEVEPDDVDINLSVLSSLDLSYHNMRCDAYMELPLMVIGYYDELSYQNATIGYLDYIGLDASDLETFLPGANFVLYSSIESIIDSLESDNIDYAITTNLVSKQILEAVPDSDGIARTFGEDCQISFSLSEEISEELGPIFNKYIARIDEGDLYTRVISTSYQANLQQEVPEILANHYQIIFLILFLLGTAATILLVLHEMKRRAVFEELVEFDPITGLLTEHKFKEECAKRIYRTYGQYTIVSIDVDNFKDINEVYGYEEGSRLLKEFAVVIRESYGEDDLFARAHADNFLILTTMIDGGSAYCGKASCSFCELPKVANTLGENYNLNVSVGGYHIMDSTIDVAHMIDCANVARQKSKGFYGCVATTYSNAMDKTASLQNEIIRTMEQAIENREFKVVYQPKIDLMTGKVCGAEALVRWVREDLSMVYPDQFIPVFEKNGFIVNLDYYMLSRVCEFISLNNPSNMPKISVNLSGITILQDNVIDKIAGIVKSYNVSPSALELEITESAIIGNIKTVMEKIDQLINLGFSISMDDFGTGISSLNRLKDINVHVLKIDREFLNNTLEDKKGVLIISNIVRMARQLGIQSIAEGVETRAQLELLGNLGCDMGQGYYFAKPLSEDDYRDFLMNYDGADNRVKEEAVLDQNQAKKIGESSVASIIMNSVDNVIYISDIVTHELYFLSKVGEQTLGNITEKDWKGKKCYEVLQGKDSPCEFCTNHLLNEETFYRWEHYNPIAKRYYDIQDKLIELENKQVRLEVATDITERATLERAVKAQLHEQQVLNECVELLHRSDLAVEDAINDLLQIVSHYYKAERGYIFAISEDGTYVYNTFEWCEESVSAQIDILQNIDITIVQHWFDKYDEAGEFYIDSINEEIGRDSEEYRILDSQGITSLVTAPLKKDNGAYSGFIGIDNPKDNVKNTSLICSVSKFIEAFFVRNELLKELHRLSFRDELTGLLNRHSYEHDLKRISQESIDTMGVAYVDINSLKLINDTSGHEAGDRAITTCADLIMKAFDKNVYRIGGDEFVILCPNMGNEEFNEKIEALRHSIEEADNIDAAIGDVWSKEFYHVLLLIREADKLMYQEKEKTKNK